MMRVRDLSAGYEDVVISGVSFEVVEGEVLGVIGPNGSGKSTLLKTLARLLEPKGGAVYLNGRSIEDFSGRELAKVLAVTTTERGDVGYLTGFEVVSLGRYPYTDAFGRLGEEDVEMVMECLRLVNGEDLANKPFYEMSDGEKQKVMIARALAQEPKVLLLDEPTSFLDAKHKIEIPLIIRRIAVERGVAVIMTTHDIELALRICDRMAMVKDGRLVAVKDVEDVGEDDLKALYGIGCFDPVIGSFELETRGEARVHVVCGGGSGAKLMRALAKNGIPFTAGVVHENDVDFRIAARCAVEVVKERAFERIGDEAFDRARELVERCGTVVETDFPVGEGNRRNLELLEYAETVYSLRNMSVREVLRRLAPRQRS